MPASGLLAKGPPAAPKWLLFVKIAIIVLSVIILALSAYAISLFGRYYYYSTGAPGYLIFLVIKTWIIYGASIVISLKAPRFYYRIAFLIAYILSIIFWLSGWAWAASWASAYLALGSYYGTGGDKSLGGALAGCAAMGAIIWILSIVNLVFFVIACIREQPEAGNVELGHGAKHGQPPAQPTYVGGQPQQQPVYGQPQQHPQQPYATQ